MPTFEINTLLPEGHFKLTFSSTDFIDFYGQQIEELEGFRRYGGLPDNGIAVNKLINTIGHNVLVLEEKISQLIRSELPSDDDILFYTKLEALSSAMTVNMLVEMAELEKDRNLDVATGLAQVREGLDRVYKHYKAQLAFTDVKEDAVREQRIDQLFHMVDQQKKKWEKRLENPTGQLTNADLRAYYQEVLDDFNQIQREITLYQRHYLGIAEFSNTSSTEAYQEASYILESHVFSEDNPDDKQLWLRSGPDNVPNRSVSTQHIPSLRKDWALRAGIVVGIKYDQVADYSLQVASISDQYLELKARIQKSNLEVKAGERAKNSHDTRQEKAADIDSFHSL